MRILVTRPIDDVAPLADRLAARGHAVLVEPLLSIELLDGPMLDIAGVQAILLTSANGARAVARRIAARDLPVLAVGDATAAAARAAGFADVASANGDVEDLARLARERLKPGSGPLLHAAGSVTAGDLARQLGEAGFTLRREVLYRAEPAAALSEATRAAFAADGIDSVLFFSPRTAATFARLAREARLEPHLQRVVAFALSPAVKTAAGGLPWRAVETAEQPAQASLIDLVDGWSSRQRGPSDAVTTDGTHRMPEPATAKPSATSASGAAPEATMRAPPPAAPGDSRGGRLASAGPWFVLGIVLGLLGAGLVGWWIGERQRIAPGPDPAAAQLTLKLADVERRLAALQSSALGTDELARGLRPVSDRLTALERSLTEVRGKLDGAVADIARAKTIADDVAGLARRLDAAEQAARTAAGHAVALAAEDRRLGQEVTRLQESVAALGGAEQATAARIAELRRGDALLLAVTQLREALRRSGPYADQIKALQALAAKDPVVAAALPSLAGRADRGVATIEELRTRFAAVAAAMVHAERKPVGDAWWDHALARLAAIVSIRRVGGDVAGESAEAIAARAEASLAHGDLAGAVAMLESTAGPAAEPLAPWLGDARARLSADRVLAELAIHTLKTAGAEP